MLPPRAAAAVETTFEMQPMGDDCTATDGVLDLKGALARLGGDEALFSDMAGFLLEDAPPLFDQLEGAIGASDALVVRSRAHALKGLLAACGGVRAAECAQSLENSGSSGDLSKAPAMLETLREELQLLMRALTAYRR